MSFLQEAVKQQKQQQQQQQQQQQWQHHEYNSKNDKNTNNNNCVGTHTASLALEKLSSKYNISVLNMCAFV